MHNFKIIKSLSEIEIKFDAFIIDIWGVLWDGIEPYEHSKSTLKKLRGGKKPVILLSNAPRRSDLVAKRLLSIGIDKNFYNTIISSGEVCREDCLANKNKLVKLGYNYYFIGQEADKDIARGLKIKQVNDLKYSSFILVCGTRSFSHTLDDYKKELDEGLKYKLPLVCANPDRVVIRQNGDLLICAGLMADYYENNGGKVFRYGKPFKRVFEKSFKYLQNLNSNIKSDNILVIGDSLETDILGANNIGYTSLLVANGIHKNELFSDKKLQLSRNLLSRLFKRFSAFPKYVIKDFLF